MSSACRLPYCSHLHEKGWSSRQPWTLPLLRFSPVLLDSSCYVFKACHLCLETDRALLPQSAYILLLVNILLWYEIDELARNVRSEVRLEFYEWQGCTYNSVFGLKYLNATASLKNFKFRVYNTTMYSVYHVLASSCLWPLFL